MANPTAMANVFILPSDTGSTSTRIDFPDSDDEAEETLLTSPGISRIAEPKDLVDMYTNVEVGVVLTMDQRDDHLLTVAEVKRGIARAERRLAFWRAKEASLIYQIHCFTQQVAEKRLTQADINIERVKSYRKQLYDKPRLAGQPYDILTEMSKTSMSLVDSMGVA